MGSPAGLTAATVGPVILSVNAPEPTGRAIRLPPSLGLLAGRDDLLADMHRRLTDGDLPSPRVVALHGVAGVGKTSLAVEYVHRNKDGMSIAWLFAADDPTGLEVQFGTLAAQLGASAGLFDARDPVASVHAALRDSATPWLVVFDNVRDEAAVREFVPPAGPGQVLITSQNAMRRPGQGIEVRTLDRSVAAGFLMNRTRDPDKSSAETLAADLDGLPLAIEQAASFAVEQGLTLAGCLGMFRRHRAELLARGEVPGHPTVAVTLGLVLDRLEGTSPVGSAAVALLRLLAWLAPEPVPLRQLIVTARPQDSLDDVAGMALRPLIGDEVAVADAVAALRRYSLVRLGEDAEDFAVQGPAVVVHKLVQSVTMDQVSAPDREYWQRAAAALVDAAIPDRPDLPRSWPEYATLLPHAQAALLAESPGMLRIASYLGHRGSYRAARDLCHTIAQAHADRSGSEDRGTLAARAEYGRWTGEAGDWVAARNLFAELVPVLERVLGPEDADTLAGRSSLAHWTGRAGDHEHARDLYAKLLPVAERELGAGNPKFLETQSSLAYWTGRAGDADRARDLYAELLPIAERVLGKAHPFTLATLGHLARWTGRGGDSARARDLFAVLLPAIEEELGPEHPDSLAIRASLARWTGEAGQPALARDMYAELLPISERVLGAVNPDTLIDRRNLARWTGEAGEPATARDMLEELLPELDQHLGPDHPDTQAARADLSKWTAACG